jgi:hypothetical protein
MSDPLPDRGNVSLNKRDFLACARRLTRGNHVLLIAAVITILGVSGRIWVVQPIFYAHAYSQADRAANIQSPLLASDADIVTSSRERLELSRKSQIPTLERSSVVAVPQSGDDFERKIRDILGDSPMREMVPFIAKRDERTAAFLVGIAKKESSFGLASPSKEGKDCYNYWGYKGEGGRGVGMGYACFASAEEAIETVGDRISVLIGKNRSTPQRMVDTWKCGVSCAGDPGAPGWVSTVALYFDKIVSNG